MDPEKERCNGVFWNCFEHELLTLQSADHTSTWLLCVLDLDHDLKYHPSCLSPAQVACKKPAQWKVTCLVVATILPRVVKSQLQAEERRWLPTCEVFNSRAFGLPPFYRRATREMYLAEAAHVDEQRGASSPKGSQGEVSCLVWLGGSRLEKASPGFREGLLLGLSFLGGCWV